MLKTKTNLKVKMTSLLFIALVVVFCLTASNEVGGSSSMYKYLVLLVCIIESFFLFIKKIKKENIKVSFKKELNAFILFIVVIIVFSIFKSIESSKFSFRTIQELLFLVCPMIYAFFIVNTLSFEEVNKLMKIGLIIVFLFYIVSLGLNINSIISAFFNSNFGESTSELESNIYCGLALAFCLFFCYYDKSNNKKYKILSVIFTIMTFKRLFVVMALFLFIISHLKIKEIKVSKKIYYISILLLVILSIAYYNILLPQNLYKFEDTFNIDLSKFTSTRSDRFLNLFYSDYSSYGFGSSTEFMYNYLDGALEMDIIKIIIELGYIPVISLIYSYLTIGKSNIYTFSFMAFQILNLLFSSSLTSSFAWIIIFISIGFISKENNLVKEDNNG